MFTLIEVHLCTLVSYKWLYAVLNLFIYFASYFSQYDIRTWPIHVN
jgi:hypothetical protein